MTSKDALLWNQIEQRQLDRIVSHTAAARRAAGAAIEPRRWIVAYPLVTTAGAFCLGAAVAGRSSSTKSRRRSDKKAEAAAETAVKQSSFAIAAASVVSYASRYLARAAVEGLAGASRSSGAEVETGDVAS